MIAGDESDFAALIERHRRELHVHCYRMLASFDDAEDAVQETLFRAWRSRDSFDGSSLFRAWLYRIATNVCLDMLRRSSRRVTEMHSFREVPWLQPYPDRLLDEVAPSGDDPDTMKEHLPARRSEWSAQKTSAKERELLERFIDAHERGDAVAAVAISAQDIRITMPPFPYLFEGLDTIASLIARGLAEGDWRLVPTQANRMPTAASYLRKPGDSEFRAFKFDVLRIEDGVIAEITTFGAALFPAFGLAPTYSQSWSRRPTRPSEPPGHVPDAGNGDQVG